MRFVTYIAIVFFCLATTTLYAQNTAILAYFQATENNGNVVLSWQIAKGSTCSGILIERATDGMEYMLIGEITGVCGSVSEAVNYNFVDENPDNNGINYYRLQLGNSGQSGIVSVQLVDVSEGYSIRPHPASGDTYLFFENGNNQNCTLAIYTASGAMVSLQSGTANSFMLNSTLLANGLYLFSITSPSNQVKAKGKLLVVN